MEGGGGGGWRNRNRHEIPDVVEFDTDAGTAVQTQCKCIAHVIEARQATPMVR